MGNAIETEYRAQTASLSEPERVSGRGGERVLQISEHRSLVALAVGCLTPDLYRPTSDSELRTLNFELLVNFAQ